MARETQRQKLLTRRAALVAGGQALLGAALVGRLYQLQVLEKDRYTVLSNENRISLRLLVPPRGRIFDRFNVALADNHQNYRVVIVPEQTSSLGATLDALGKLIQLTDEDRRRFLREVRQRHKFIPVEVRTNLTWDEMARIEVAIPELPGVSIEQGLLRFYPYGAEAAHVLGYVAAVSDKDLNGDPILELPDFRIGKTGIEKSQDLKLRGTAGTSQVEVNAYGRVVRELAQIPGQPGEDVVSALDMVLQDFVVRRCAEQIAVSCVVLDVVTGDVLAMVSSPSFDPMVFSTGLTQAMWHQLSTDPRHPLTNKATAGLYPPGSTFKPMTAMAALHTGAITPDTVINCPGYLELGDATFHCWRAGGHGPLHVHGAIEQSCDVFFYETARRTGIDHIAAMARRFGFGSPLGLDIPGELGGLMPTREWQIASTGRPWEQGETLIAGIGQGSVLATPLQLTMMAARLVTGRAVVPHLVRANGLMPPGGDPNAGGFEPLGVSAGALAIVLGGMNAVCNSPRGTAYAQRITDPQYAMGGKSGTSQVRRITPYEREHGLLKPQDVPWKDRDHALFVAYAPVGAPRYACGVVVEHGGNRGGGGAEVAAPIVHDVLLRVQQRDPGRRIPAPAEIAQQAPAPPPAPSPG